MAPADGYDGFLFDLDGVIWLGEEPIPGAAEAVASLIAAGKGVAFLTNNPRASADDYAGRLRREGIEVGAERIVTAGAVTAALAAASPAAERGAFVIGTDSFKREVEGAGTSLLDGEAGAEAGIVVVSGHSGFDYGELRIATAALLRGAELFATNRDPTMPMPGGLWPGTGSILAAVETASGALGDGRREAAAADLRAGAVPGPGLESGDGGRPPRLRHRGRGRRRAGDDPRPHRLHRPRAGSSDPRCGPVRSSTASPTSAGDGEARLDSRRCWPRRPRPRRSSAPPLRAPPTATAPTSPTSGPRRATSSPREGPRRDPDHLDSDGDGTACETLPCPCRYGSGGGGRPARRIKARIVHVVDGDTVGCGRGTPAGAATTCA